MHQLYKLVNQQKSLTRQTTTTSPYTFSELPAGATTLHDSTKKYISHYNLFRLTDNSGTLSRVNKNADLLQLKIPVPGKPVSLDLIKNDLVTADFKISTSDGRTITDAVSGKQYYMGVVHDDSISTVAISIGADGMDGLISNSSGNYMLQTIPSEGKGIHIGYFDKELQQETPWQCETKSTPVLPAGITAHTTTERVASCKVVRLYIECSYNLFATYGSDVNKTMDYVLGIFNIVSGIYKNDGINIQLSELFIWTMPDIYQGSTSVSDVHNLFSRRSSLNKENGRGFNADIGLVFVATHLGGGLTGGNISDCESTQMKVATCTNMNTYTNFPDYSYAVHVFAHETGHLLGSPHTQSCSWPGGAIDNCKGPEGNCAPGPKPVNGGTIMSYCHAGQNFINFSLGLGPLPAALIRSVIEQSSCVTACVVPSCDSLPVKEIKTLLSDTLLVIKWKNEGFTYRVGVRSNINRSLRYIEVTNADSAVFTKTACEDFLECSIATFCTATQKYSTNYIFTTGKNNYTDFKFRLFYTKELVVCAGDSLTTEILPNQSGFTYNWYNNDTLLPYLNNKRLGRLTKIGNYYVKGERGGCIYTSDTIHLSYRKPVADFEPQLNAGSYKGVSFTNYATCGRKFNWDFGDGESSTLRTPIHTYKDTGMYTVCLQIIDSVGQTASVCKQVLIYEAIIDSLNVYTTYGFHGPYITYKNFACRQVSYVRSDSLDLIVFPNPGAFSYYTSLPLNGTTELKIYPVKTIQTIDNKATPSADTGLILCSYDSKLILKFSKTGGLELVVNSIRIGSIAPGYAGPLNFNQWNTIGISYGQQGIQLMVNGSIYGFDNSIISRDVLPRNLAFYVGGFTTILPNSQYLYQGFEGALDLIRFSQKEQDWTFTKTPTWQGMDTVVINKTICYGSTFNGFDRSGIYYSQNTGVGGCDSVTTLGLRVADDLSIADTVVHAVDNNKGAVLLNTISGGTGPYSFVWNTGQATRNLENVSAGNYQLTLSDSLGCKKEFSFRVLALDAKKDDIVIMPNPALPGMVSQVRITTNALERYTMQIIDIAGRKQAGRSIYPVNRGVNYISLPRHFVKGIYFVQLTDESGRSRTVKWMVQ
jgi:Metallo-peptidase family M12/PKD domain/Reprolysin family propeptide